MYKRLAGRRRRRGAGWPPGGAPTGRWPKRTYLLLGLTYY